MKLRTLILLFLLVFGLTPLLIAVAINLPLVLDRTALFYQRAYLQNLRADFRDLDQHLASRQEMARLLARLPDPGLILGEPSPGPQVDLARERATGWMKQILADQADIIQVLFLDRAGQDRFWLARDPRTLEWRAGNGSPQLPSADFVEAGLKLDPGAVIVSRIRVDPTQGASDPRRLITLNLVSPLSGAKGQSRGLVVLVIDVGGLAEFYRDTVWVNQDGSYLRPGQPAGEAPEAFQDFPGLKEIFAQRSLALWKGGGWKGEGPEQFLWVPMFATEDGQPLWVGRAVDPSPIEHFRNTLMVRVLSIIFFLVVTVMVLARWIARRMERFGQELTGGIGQILRDGQPLRFQWRGPREVRQLGEQLTALAGTHADHLQAAREHTRALERSNRYKSEFLANVSHELRTPLNSILLLSKMLAAEGGGLSEVQRRQARVIHEAGIDLRTLIDDILDISRIEAGRVPVSREWLDLPPVLDDLLELVRPLVGEKPVALELRLDPGAPHRVLTDREKLRQILKNFLSNAIKFTDRGQVTLALEAVEEAVGGAVGETGTAVALSVTDTGIGIPQDKQEVIFEAFQQADGSTRRRYGGTGLGLSISRELAGLLGARIEVQSAPGAGARFSLILPLSPAVAGVAGGPVAALPPPAPAEDEAEPPQLPVGSPGQWVLIIDRDVPTLIRLAELLRVHGLGVQTAADLDEGLETLREEPRGCILVLLAAQASDGQTCDTLKRFAKGAPEPGVPVVVMRDAFLAHQETACREAGAFGFLAKPVSAPGLGAVLGQLPATAAAGPAVAGVPVQHDRPGGAPEPLS